MRKRFFLAALAAIMGTAVAVAQQIAVVSESGSSDLYQTLAEAIEGADPGSTIYLPGGRFTISDDVRIIKKLTIIGIGHYLNNEENEDGRTFIDGHLSFDEGSSGSSVMGCYLEKSINIGTNLGNTYNSTVNDFTLRYCNVWDICVSSSSVGTTIDQNYIRAIIYFNTCTSGVVSNNILRRILKMNGGTVCNNVFTNIGGDYPQLETSNTIIYDNVFVKWRGITGSGYSFYHNLFINNSSGDDYLNLANVNSADVFIKDDGVMSTSNYHFQDAYKQYESQYGIYSGSGFSDKQLAPVPYIVDKQVASETDASGKLNIKIRVKASE